MKKHFVVFLWPGSFVAEDSRSEIDSWDVQKATDMARKFKHMPYGFYFTTRERGPLDLDSRESDKSGMYYLGGTTESLEEIKARNDRRDHILITNMECNGWPAVVRTSSGWTQPLRPKDTIIPIEK